MLRVKIHFKYIIPVYFKWGEKKTTYELLDISRWKNLNKINGGEEWWCGIFERLEDLTLFMNYNLDKWGKKRWVCKKGRDSKGYF
jgi:hypothetical protein